MCALRQVSSVVALFVVLFCGQALAAGTQPDPPVDYPVSIYVDRKSASASPIGTCWSSKTSYNVRIHSVKTKTTIFRRVLMDMVIIETYPTKQQNFDSKHIGDCAEKADAGGFDGFSFINSLCKAFSIGRHPCRCDTGTGTTKDQIYVQDSFWGNEGNIIHEIESGGEELLEFVPYPSTVLDQRDNIDGVFPAYSSWFNESDSQLMVEWSKNKGLFVVMCQGIICRLTTYVDTDDCPTGCNNTSNWVIQRMTTYETQQIDDLATKRYFLSECGNTIVMNATLPYDSNYTLNKVMSHEGYGCKWYPKAAQDTECAVTLASSNAVKINLLSMVLDGNPSTCEGDSLTIYKGKQGDGVRLAKITACDNGKTVPDAIMSNATEYAVVFKRFSKQYRTDGFNFGFLMTIFVSN